MKVLQKDESSLVRELYIYAFIDSESEWYINHIKTMQCCVDGLCYDGYLWECLKKGYKFISVQHAIDILQSKKYIYLLYDLHSCEKILQPNYWKYAKAAVLFGSTEEFLSEMPHLPEDIYVFDDTFTWSVIFTHEITEKGRRICMCVENDKFIG